MGSNVHGPLATDLTKQMCQFIKTLTYEDIPPAVIERAKMMIMQTVGVSICSAELQLVKDAIEISKEMSPGSEGVATLWADGARSAGKLPCSPPVPWAILWTGRIAP